MTGASYTRKTSEFVEVIPIAEQNTLIEQFAKKNKIIITKKYTDRKDRVDAEDGFLEMKEDGICRKYDCLFIWSFMCFGRDPLVGYNLLLHTFLPAGIDFAVVVDDFISVGKTAPEIEAYLESKYKERRLATMCNHAAMARASKINMSYGYKIVNGEYVIDDDVKENVDNIFSMALDGKSRREICKWLNDHQIESPMHYLKKVAGRNVEGIPVNWTEYSVKRIISDSMYKGMRRTVRSGEEHFLAIPSYINEKQYEKLNGNNNSVKRMEHWSNPLYKRIFDKDTGVRMHAGDYINNNIKYYYPSRQTEETKQYKKKEISTDKVIENVNEVLNREHKTALYIRNLISTDVGQTEFIKRTEGYRKELSKLLEQMLCCIDISDTAELERIDKLFSDVEEKVNFYKKAFSLRNPWLDLYKDLNDGPLSLEKAKKYIDKVLVEKNEKIEVIIHHNEYKECFPKSWTEWKK